MRLTANFQAVVHSVRVQGLDGLRDRSSKPHSSPTNDADHAAALARINELWERRPGLGVKPRNWTIATLVAAYEARQLASMTAILA